MARGSKGVVIPISFDIEDATKSAEKMGQKIDEALSKHKGTEDPRIAATIKSLEKLQRQIQSTADFRDKLTTGSDEYKQLQGLAEEWEKKEQATRAALRAYKDYLTEIGKGKLVENFENRGPTNIDKAYFGKNRTPEITEQINQLKKLQEAWANASREKEKFFGQAYNKAPNPLTQDESDAIAKNFQTASDSAEVFLLKLNAIEQQNEKINQKPAMQTYTRTFYLMRTLINDLHRGIDKLNDKLSKFTHGIANAAKSMLGLNKESKHTTSTLNNGFKHALTNILKYGFGIRSLFFLFRRLRKYAIEALGEMAKTFPEVNTQMSRAVTALNQMKGALGTAIQPLLTVVVPVLEKIAALISKIMSLIGGVFATLTGQGKIYQAVATQTDYAASLDKTGASAKKAKKELEGYLSPIDEINKYQSKKDDDDAGGGAGAGGVGYKMVETPVSGFAKKIADVLKKLWAPIKKAWDDMGKIVTASWKRAWNSVKKLLIDIGKDFLTMWNQEATVEMFRDIFRILANIGDVVHFLAKNFDEVWNKNKVGLHILEKIRDIFAIIIKHIEKATDATVEWAKNLDFSPLLNAFDKFLESIKPVVDNIAGVFEDFYTQVMLPLAKWTLEKGLPEILGVFEDFNNKVDWEGLRAKLSELWEHLEPFAERVGEGLIMFIDDVMNKIADFINGGGLDELIDKLNEFMDNITAEDVASTIWDIVNAIIALKAASSVLSILSSLALTIKEVAIGLEALQGVKSVGAIISTLGGIAAIISGLILTVKEFFDMWTNGWNGLSTILEALGIALVTIGVVLLAPIEGVGIAIAAAVAAAVFAISQIAIAVHDNWDSIVAWYEANIQPAIDAVKQAIADLVGAIVSWWNSDIKPVIDSVGEEVSRVYVEYIAPTVAYLKEMIANIWSLLQVYWNGHVKPMLQLIGTVVKSLWETTIKPTLTYLKEGFSKAFTFIGDVIKTAVKLIGSQINALMQVLNGIIKFVTGVFTGDWRKAWDGVKDIFKGIINGIVSIFEAGINLIVSALNAIQIPVPWDWAQKVVGSSSIGFNVSRVSLPRLAEGAVIPPNKEFMAMLGDQKSGTNIETPLSTMIEAFNTALNQNGGGKTTTINFLLPDRRKVAQYVIEGGKVMQTSLGRNPFDLA